MAKMAASMVETGEDAFRKMFKRYRTKRPPPDFTDVLDFSTGKQSDKVTTMMTLGAPVNLYCIHNKRSDIHNSFTDARSAITWVTAIAVPKLNIKRSFARCSDRAQQGSHHDPGSSSALCLKVHPLTEASLL